jgi:hypothetical protein
MPSFFHLRGVLLLAGSMLGVVACERKDLSIPLAQLTARRWRLSNYVFCMEEPTTPGEQYRRLEPCVRDDFTVFKADGTYVDDEGTLQCRPDVPQARRFAWRFLSEGRELGMYYAEPGQKEEELRFKIITLSPTTLILEGWAPAYPCKYQLTYTAF